MERPEAVDPASCGGKPERRAGVIGCIGGSGIKLLTATPGASAERRYRGDGVEARSNMLLSCLQPLMMAETVTC